MNRPDIAVAEFSSHDQADRAVRALGRAGFDLARISLVGEGFHSEERVLGYASAGDTAARFGRVGLLLGAVSGVLVGATLTVMPLFGNVVAVGWYSASIAGGIEGGLLGGMVGALVGALSAVGLGHHPVLRYRRNLGADHYKLFLNGSGRESLRAHYVLADADITCMAPRQAPGIEPDMAAAG